MQIRPATAADASALAAVQCASWQAAYRDILPQHIIDAWNAKRPAMWASYFQNTARQTQTLVCQLDQQLAGFALFGPVRDEDIKREIKRDMKRETKDVAELYSLYVDPAHWRRGVGAALCAAVIERARGAGWGDLCVWTFAANERSRRFYEAVGFTLDGGRRKDLTLEGSTFPEVCYWIRAVPVPWAVPIP